MTSRHPMEDGTDERGTTLLPDPSRCDLRAGGHSSAGPAGRLRNEGSHLMTYITTQDGTRIFYKDWGPRDAPPIVFHHGWPLSADDWDNQMMFFLAEGYRVIAHDRRGHGRSDQTDGGNEMDTYAADVAELVMALDLKDAIHVGHSTGGGEVTRYVARAEPGRVAKAVLIDAVPPVMVKKESNPGGTRSRCSTASEQRSRPIVRSSTS